MTSQVYMKSLHDISRSDGFGQPNSLLLDPSVNHFSPAKDKALWEETSKHTLAEKACCSVFQGKKKKKKK